MRWASNRPISHQGVDREDAESQGAGDQGLMFGYACNETDVLMPAPITYSHRLVKRQAEVRKAGIILPWLRPDAKSQVTFVYETMKTGCIDAVVLVVATSRRRHHESDLRGRHHGRDHQADPARRVDQQKDQIPHQPDRAL